MHPPASLGLSSVFSLLGPPPRGQEGTAGREPRANKRRFRGYVKGFLRRLFAGETWCDSIGFYAGRSLTDTNPSMSPLPWKGVPRKFLLTVNEMEDERSQAEAAENKCGERCQQQCLLDISCEVPAEKEQSSYRQGDETGHALRKPAGRWRRGESKCRRPCADGAVVEGVEGAPPGKQCAPPENPR